MPRKAISVINKYLYYLGNIYIFIKWWFYHHFIKVKSMLFEELKIETEIEKINNNFRKYLSEVFSSVFIKKLDRVFKEPLIIENFKKDNNVMALTVGTKISVNSKMFNELPTDKAMVYIFHELFHVLQNVSQFPEVKTLNRMLQNKTMSKININDINKFLTGKEQNIHSNYKDEFLSYCSNFAFDWSLCKELKSEYYRILNQSGIFNLESRWWKKRFK